MKKYIGIFARGIGLGLGLGLCLAGLIGLVYRMIHSADLNPHFERATIYFLVVGGLLGSIGGWCLSLQMILGGLLSALFLKISELVPVPAAAVTEEWAHKMEVFFSEVLRPMPSLFHKVVEGVLVVRFRDYGKINRAIERAKKKQPTAATSPEWIAQVALHFFLEPLWLFFYGAYAILLLCCCVFWSLPFFN